MNTHLITSLLAGSLLLAGCASEEEVRPAGEYGTSLRSFESCDDLRAYVAEAYVEQLVWSRYAIYYDYAVAGEDDSSSGPDEYSETNTQEEGVDEADLVKTDGEYIYIAQQGELTVLASWPAEDTGIVGRLNLDGNPFALYLYGDTAVVYGSDYDTWEGGRYNGLVTMSVVDISDRAAPELVREIDVEGWYVDSRRIDGDVYTVATAYIPMPDELWEYAWSDTLGLPEVTYDETDAELAAKRQQARLLLRPIVLATVVQMSESELLPMVRDSSGTLLDGPVLTCSDVFRPDALGSTSVMSVLSLDLDSGDIAATGLMADGWTVYASQDDLYVTQSSYYWYNAWDEESDVRTAIHRFSLDGGEAIHDGSGVVDGWLLNQFSMGAHDGYLRVATSDLQWWGTGDGNHIFVLDDSMETVGSIRDIAPGETIYSARFQGDRGYLVTFQQTDPLFTLDLSDPTAPEVVGELEIPGYSSYLHPVGDDFLLAVGMEGDDEGNISGFAVSLFDVSDFANPVRAAQYTFESEWTWSESLYDHHAFTLYRDVLAVPAYSYEDGAYFSGLLLLDVDTEAGTLTERGTIDHGDLVADSECLYADSTEPCDEAYWYSAMRRGLFIEDYVYSVSDYGLKVNELDDLDAEVARVVFWPAE